MKTSIHVNEIETTLKRFPARTSRQVPEAYIGGGQSRLRYIGLKVPHLRQALRTGFSFSEGAPTDVARIWNDVWWNSDCFEVMALALMWFEHPKRREQLVTNWPILKRWSARIDNWAHADALAGLYSRVHENAPEVYATFKFWNRSKNPWLRRLSIVSLFYYSSQRTKYPSFARVKALVDPQLEYDHHYVQRGVGWTLRETGNVYPKETLAYLEKNIHKLSAIAFSAATEKMPTKSRERLKRLRRERRH